MTRRDTLQTVHEPFGDAFYFGPERLHDRYENNPEERKTSGFGDSTYRTIFDNIARDGAEVRCSPSVYFTFISQMFASRRSLSSIHSNQARVHILSSSFVA